MIRLLDSPTVFGYHETDRMEFRKRHKRLYAFWVAISVLVILSMIGFLVVPFLY